MFDTIRELLILGVLLVVVYFQSAAAVEVAEIRAEIVAWITTQPDAEYMRCVNDANGTLHCITTGANAQ